MAPTPEALISPGIDAAGIKAAYADGVLRVTLPKQKEVPASSRRLEIE